MKTFLSIIVVVVMCFYVFVQVRSIIRDVKKKRASKKDTNNKKGDCSK